MKKVEVGIRILLGLMMVVFGLNKFLHFVPMPPPSEEMINFFIAIMQFLPSILVLIIFYNLSFKYKNLLKICLISSFFFSFFVFIHGFSFIFANLNFLNPFEHTEAVYLQETGFSSYKSNWSNAIAVMFPLTILFYTRVINHTAIVWFLVIAIFFVQVLSGGRAGIISSLIVNGIIMSLNCWILLLEIF